MTDSLAVYLHDHLAGANFAVELLEFLRDEHSGEPLGNFAGEMLVEIEQDRKVLQDIIETAGGGVPVIKGAAAWVGEKVSRLKLSRGDFGTFESLEALALGVQGKLALWHALATIAEFNSRVRGQNFDQLASRAKDQHSRVEQRRLEAATAAFAPAKTNT